MKKLFLTAVIVFAATAVVFAGNNCAGKSNCAKKACAKVEKCTPQCTKQACAKGCKCSKCVKKEAAAKKSGCQRRKDCKKREKISVYTCNTGLLPPSFYL